MTEIFYAHSKDGEPPEHWQTLEDHLRQVAELASTFAAAFKSDAWLRAAGKLHDIGKAHPDFQAYLRSSAGGLDASEYDDQGTGSHPNHSGAGAILAYEKWHDIIGKTLAYVVAGHHAGLPDWFGGRDSLPYRLANEKSFADTVRSYAKPFLDELSAQLHPPAFAMRCRNQNAVAYHLWVRMPAGITLDEKV